MKFLEEQLARQKVAQVSIQIRDAQAKAERFEGMYMKKIKQVLHLCAHVVEVECV